MSMPVPGQPVTISPEELARAQDDDNPIAQNKQQVLSQDFTVDPALRQIHPPYRFLSAEFPRLRVDSVVLPVVDPSDATHTCPIVPISLVTRVLEIAHAGPRRV